MNAMLASQDGGPQTFTSLDTVDFTKQYSNLYHARLSILRPLVLQRVGQEAANMGTLSCHGLVARIADLELQKQSLIVGTVFIDDPSKPSILAEFTDTVQSRRSGVQAYLEDESGRIRLEGGRSGEWLLNGTVVAAFGMESDNAFLIQNITQLGFPPQPCRPSGLQLDPSTSLLFLSDVDVLDHHWNLFFESIVDCYSEKHKVPACV